MVELSDKAREFILRNEHNASVNQLARVFECKGKDIMDAYSLTLKNGEYRKYPRDIKSGDLEIHLLAAKLRKIKRGDEGYVDYKPKQGYAHKFGRLYANRHQKKVAASRFGTDNTREF